ncbi:hypothetical protein D3C77_657150 [compost metagenome]
MCSSGVNESLAVPLSVLCSLKPLTMWSSSRWEVRPYSCKPTNPSTSGPEMKALVLL